MLERHRRLGAVVGTAEIPGATGDGQRRAGTGGDSAAELAVRRAGADADRLASWYCHRSQVAVDESGWALLDAKGKEWETKSSTEGDEGPEENWGWEEK